MGLLGTYATALEAFDDRGVFQSPWGEGLPWFAAGGVIEGAGIVLLIHRLAQSLLVTALALVLMATTYLIGVGTVMALRDQDLARYAAADCSRGCSGPAPVVTRRSG
jgi:hypothetical protein